MKTLFCMLGVVLMVSATTDAFGQPETVKVNSRTKTSEAANPAARPDNTGRLSGAGSFAFHNDLSGIEGQIYIGKDWPVGRIVLRNGNIIDNYNLRYNLMSDQMQFVAGKDTLAFGSPTELHSVAFDNHVFVYETFQCENLVRQGYFELLEPGRNRLLLKRSVVYHSHEKDETDDPGNVTYMIDECYFISRPGVPAYKVMCNRKSALNAMGDRRKEMETYMKATGNKVRNESDLRKMVAYYNSLDANK